MYRYIADYEDQGTLLHPEKVDYEIPNFEKIMESYWNIRMELISVQSVKEFSDLLKEVAKQYMPIFMSENSRYKDLECLKF